MDAETTQSIPIGGIDLVYEAFLTILCDQGDGDAFLKDADGRG